MSKSKPHITSAAQAILIHPLGEAQDLFKVDTTGIWRKVHVKDADDKWEWICAPIEVVAYFRAADNDGWGKVLRFRDPDGVKHQWEMPEEMLAGDKSELCGQLLRRGLRISTSKGAAEFLREYLQRFRSDRRARTVERIGWSDENCTTFVLPNDQTITSNGAEMIILKPTREMRHCLKSRGTLDEWKRNISRYCSGNSRLLFAMSCAAAAPLLPLFTEPSGGFHFYGATSVGKTTILTVAGSFWGGGGQNGFVQSWLTTANALENTAESHNNVLLLLDELKLIDPEHASKVAYSLSNGQSKGRMDRNTNARRGAEWKLLYLSTGELDLASHIEATQKRIYGGQEVRFCGIPVQVDETNGAFESLHHFKSPKLFATHLLRNSCQHYGEASRAFLRQIVRMGRSTVREHVQRYRQEFINRFLSGSEGADVARAGDRFALVAAAGELLTELGITDWKPGEAKEAADKCFRDWIQALGTDGNLDELRAVNFFKQILITHGDSRFQVFKQRPNGQISDDSGNKSRTVNRIGFRREGPEGDTEYIIPPGSLKDVCGQFHPDLLVRAPQKRRLLETSDSRHKTVLRTLPELGRSAATW